MTAYWDIQNDGHISDHKRFDWDESHCILLRFIRDLKISANETVGYDITRAEGGRNVFFMRPPNILSHLCPDLDSDQPGLAQILRTRNGSLNESQPIRQATFCL